MRLLVLFLIGLIGPLQAQEIAGEWRGTLDVNGFKLRLVVHLHWAGQAYAATMDSPDQGAKGIPVDSVTFENGLLKLEVPVIGARYEGRLAADTMLAGQFFQGGGVLPLRLVRGNPEEAVVARPQEPKPPFPYASEEVRIPNDAAGVTLAGTLTYPGKGGPFPAVVLITGSGPQNRDEELFGHKPFLVIADYLTRQGIAVLRYDDRGVGTSTGSFGVATSADFATDAVSAFTFLKSASAIDSNKIGLLGHSEGGMVAAMATAELPDVAFLVLMAAPGIPIDRLMITQNRMLGQAAGMSTLQLDAAAKLNSQIYNVVIAERDEEELTRKLHELLMPVFDTAVVDGRMTPEQANAAVAQQTGQLTSPWMRYFLRFDPGPYLRRVKCPVLALNGSNDLQVASKENLAGIATASQAGGNRRITTRELPGLNHLFQESTTALPSEYGTISQTISPQVLLEISHWIAEQGM